MAWSNSKIFRQFLADALGNTAALDLDSDTITVALYNNTPTPDQNVTAANSAYNVGQWVTANEVWQAGQWAQAGVNLASKVIDVATSAVVMFDAADTASGSAATLANVYGCLVYENTLTTPVADQGICYNYFGGVQSVTSGTFTIQWSANGIARFTL
jgi:hypothetical protein